MVFKCDICGKTGFKSKAGLIGHQQIAHGVEKRKSYPDEIGKRLEAVEGNLNKLATAWVDNNKTLQDNDSRILDLIEKFIEASKNSFEAVKDWIETSTKHQVNK